MPDPHQDGGDPLSHASPAVADSAGAVIAAAGSSGNSTANKWGPYSGAGDFGANMAIVLAALFCAAVLGFSLGAAVRFILRERRRSRGPRLPTAAAPDGDQKPEAKAAAAAAAALPTMVFSAAEAGKRLAGAGPAECAICLTEFVEGDSVRVLPACSHGFHVRCVERWLEARSSCPTCRCLIDGEKKQEEEEEAAAAQVGSEAV